MAIFKKIAIIIIYSNSANFNLSKYFAIYF